MEKLNRIHPRYGDTIPLHLNHEISDDDGQGM
jgi:hypothetical protein